MNTAVKIALAYLILIIVVLMFPYVFPIITTNFTGGGKSL
jgi:hypothetical protein